MKRLLWLALCSLWLLGARSSSATDLRDVMTDITITSWNEKDGLPLATIYALTQDKDGYLWVGTRQGLFRFDGVRFVPWDTVAADALPNPWVRALLTTSRGEMWIGFGTAGQVARGVDGHLTTFVGARALGSGSVMAIAEDADGVIWIGTEKGLFECSADRCRRAPFAEGAIVGLFTDRAGTLYVAASAGVFQRARGTTGFQRLSNYGDAYGSFAEGNDGRVWVTDPRVGYHRLAEDGPVSPALRQGRGLRMLVDRKGNLWTGTGGQGLWRARMGSEGSSVERTTSLTGLLGDGVYALLEDREGNIWAGTTEGLNRVTPRTIEQIIDLGLVRAVDMDPSGHVWVATVDKLFVYPTPGNGQRAEMMMSPDTRALAIDRYGVWRASAAGVARVGANGRELPLRWKSDARADTTDGLLPDGNGGVWLVAASSGIVHWTLHGAESLQLPAEVQGSEVTAAFADSRRRVWFAFANGRIATWTPDQGLTLFPALTDRLVVRTMTEDAERRLWIGGDGVLATIEGTSLRTLHSSPRFPFNVITAIVQDDRGSLWFGSSIGIVHLLVDEFDRASRDSSVSLRYTVYNRSDGVAGTPVAVPFNRGAVRAPDGRMWFVTTRGVTVLDPHVLALHNAPVPVRFEGAVADDRRIAPGAATTLPAGTRKLEVDYTVVNLATPLKSRFRYRLDPFDSDWVDASGRRQAFYTNLKPGAYTFHVAAAGVGSDASSEASWRFSVAPMFYQTTAFAAGSTAALCLLVLGGWRLRERHLRKQFALVIAERARLGREIHDTILQGLVAIALQFDCLAHEMAPLPQLQLRFFRLRDRVEEYIRDARRSIWDLHTQPPHRNLVESLRRAGEFATDGRDISFSLEVKGTPFECPSRVEEQVVRIAQEASLNSVRHADPRRLRIALTYEDTAVTISVADDGRGFDSHEAKGGGHYGLTSMLERAKSVGGALTLVTAPGQGTEVTAVLPIAS